MKFFSCSILKSEGRISYRDFIFLFFSFKTPTQMTLNKILGTWCRNGRYNDKINSFVELTGSCTVKIWVFADKKISPVEKLASRLTYCSLLMPKKCLLYNLIQKNSRIASFEPRKLFISFSAENMTPCKQSQFFLLHREAEVCN